MWPREVEHVNPALIDWLSHIDDYGTLLPDGTRFFTANQRIDFALRDDGRLEAVRFEQTSKGRKSGRRPSYKKLWKQFSTQVLHN